MGRILRYFAQYSPILCSDTFAGRWEMKYGAGRDDGNEECGRVKRCGKVVRASERRRGIQEEEHQMPPRVAPADWSTAKPLLLPSLMSWHDWSGGP